MVTRERELEINPEVIRGRGFRVPTIIGKGSGAGFNFDGLHLPIGWQEKLSNVQAIRSERLQGFFDIDCRSRGFVPGEVVYDPTTGLLTELNVRTDPISKVFLVTEFPDTEEGLYRGENIDNLMVAIILQKSLIGFLNLLRSTDDRFIPYIDGDEEGRVYYSANLSIPIEFLKSEKPLTDESYQRRFEVQASNIAGRFGLTLKTLHFNEQGIPSPFDVEEGSACGYILDDNGKYYGHNVDTSEQVAVLHGIAASFINYLLVRKDGQYY